MAARRIDEHDWYAVLGLDPSATDAEIGRAFRTLARRFHPDVGSEASGASFSDIARAYEVLGHPARRAHYDRLRSGLPGGGVTIPVRRWATGPTESPRVDSAPPPGGSEDTEVAVSVSFLESLSGSVVKIGLPQVIVCGECAGSGRRSPGACDACGGAGRYRRGSGDLLITHICSSCGGSGARPPEPCGACGGRGWRETRQDLTVRVPAGVADGTRLRLRSPSGGRPVGFARVRVLPDPWFSREDRDVVLRLPLNLAEAALGTVIELSLVDGPVQIPVPSGTGPGARLRVKGRGVPGPAPGDLVAAVEVVWPIEPTAEERAALERFAAVSRPVRASWPSATAPHRP